MSLKKKTKVNQDKNKSTSSFKGKQMVFSKISKKEFDQLKAAYKSGKLKFDSKEVTESILKDFKNGLTK